MVPFLEKLQCTNRSKDSNFKTTSQEMAIFFRHSKILLYHAQKAGGNQMLFYEENYPTHTVLSKSPFRNKRSLIFSTFFHSFFPPTFFAHCFWQWYSLKRFNHLWFCKWDPNDRAVKVNTYLKSPKFSASNCECCNSLSSFWILNVHARFSVYETPMIAQ